METQEVEILLVEDNPNDAELTIRALKKHRLANSLVWVKDGAEALDFIFAQGAYSGRSVGNAPKVILLDLRLPKMGEWKSCSGSRPTSGQRRSPS